MIDMTLSELLTGFDLEADELRLISHVQHGVVGPKEARQRAAEVVSQTDEAPRSEVKTTE